jgi:Cu(I)/Ag(I) efflux system periplasmic protein CusF
LNSRRRVACAALLGLCGLAGPSAGADRTPALSRGVVVELYRDEGRVLLRHGPIPSLDMSPMTMEFVLPDATLLRRLKKGDKIRFSARRSGDDYVLTHAEIAK